MLVCIAVQNRVEALHRRDVLGVVGGFLLEDFEGDLADYRLRPAFQFFVVEQADVYVGQGFLAADLVDDQALKLGDVEAGVQQLLQVDEGGLRGGYFLGWHI